MTELNGDDAVEDCRMDTCCIGCPRYPFRCHRDGIVYRRGDPRDPKAARETIINSLIGQVGDLKEMVASKARRLP